MGAVSESAGMAQAPMPQPQLQWPPLQVPR